METLIHLDTHVVFWMYLNDRKRLRPVSRTLEKFNLAISPVVALELQFLYEIGRVNKSGEMVISDLAERVGLRQSDAPLSQVVHHSLNQAWTRDPFDRLIVANAIVDDCALLTCDSNMLEHCKRAFWR